MRSIFSFYLLVIILFSYSNGLRAQVQVELNPIVFTSDDLDERIDQIYATCANNVINLDSTIQFVLNGCDAPILISMDSMRTINPLDPDAIGENEIELEAPYQFKFEEEGMYIVYCDDSFKSIATCLNIVKPNNVPTLSEWAIYLLSLCLLIVSLVYLKQPHFIDNTDSQL